MSGTTCVTDRKLGRYFIQRRRLRDFMPGADGRANPLQWWAWRWLNEDETDEGREWLAGPFDTRRELETALLNFAK